MNFAWVPLAIVASIGAVVFMHGKTMLPRIVGIVFLGICGLSAILDFLGPVIGVA